MDGSTQRIDMQEGAYPYMGDPVEAEVIPWEPGTKPIELMTDRELAIETVQRLRNIDDALKSFANMNPQEMISQLFGGGSPLQMIRRKKNRDAE